MSRIHATTNFRDSGGVDLGQKLITKDYLISVYPSIGEKIGIPPELWTWGSNAQGQLGTNGGGSKSTPVTTSAGGTNWKQVDCGSIHTAAIKTDGTLWNWGDGSSGRLGIGVLAAVTNKSTPVTTFAGGSNWKQVSCGNNHTAAIKTDGTLWTWGATTNGRLGNRRTILSIYTPVTTFAGGTNWKQVDCGSVHTAAIKTDGTLWVWGSGGNGRLGNGIITGNRSTPLTTFAGGTNWKQVSAGYWHTAAIKTDGTLWVWGNGFYGKLGNNSTTNRSTPVTTFAGGSNWKQVSCGGNNSGPGHTAAIKTDGTLWTWGQGTRGQLGDNTSTTRSTPVTTFAGGTNWKQVSAGGVHTAAIKTDGTIWIWGNGSSGQLGNGITTGGAATPVTTFAGGTNWKQVSGGGSHTAAIKSVDF
jgi:alpha-tubulin suppressor-like RCC1 family protein